MQPKKSSMGMGRNASRALLVTGFVLAFFCLYGTSGSVTVQLLHIGTGYSAGADLSGPLGIFHDSDRNECYIADTGNHQVVVYDENGMPIFRFYHHVMVDGEKRLGEPKHIAVDADGQIYVTDSVVPYLDILDRNGRHVTSVDPPYSECGEYARFDAVAVGPDKKIYASISSEAGRYIGVIGFDYELENIIHLESDGLGEACVTAIDVDTEGAIYITDPCASVMVQIYDANGKFKSGFGRHDSGFENFSHPTSISVMPEGNIWVVDSIRQVVSYFTPEGEFISYAGGKGDHPGAFNYPSAVDTDGKDRLFVVERAGNRYQCFRIVSDDVETSGQ
jgi:DNA-binding beta-propeller fold protein YncE